jgi:hypothetical protein
VGFVNEHPMVGSIVSRMRERVRRGVPNYIAGTEPSRSAIDTYSFGSAYLGVATHPFMVTGDPSSPRLQGTQPRPCWYHYRPLERSVATVAIARPDADATSTAAATCKRLARSANAAWN